MIAELEMTLSTTYRNKDLAQKSNTYQSLASPEMLMAIAFCCAKYVLFVVYLEIKRAYYDLGEGRI